MTPTLVLADDHEILREAFAHYLASHAGFRVVASVPDAQSAVHACRFHKPDLLLIDIDMPGRDPLAAIEDVHAIESATRSIIFTAHCQDTLIDSALLAGVSGYLLKSDPPAAILEALTKALSGTRVYSPAVRARLADAPDARRRHPASSRLATLTPRESEVLRNIARGLDNEQMAQSMCLSKRTIERHVARLMDAIGIRDRAAIVKFAYEQRLVA